MDKQTTYLQAIQAVYPNVVIERLRSHNTEGQFNDILIVNEALIFRFPRYKPGIETLKRETAVLHHLHPLLPIPIPHPLYHNLETAELGRAFMGYPLLPGQPLWREIWNHLNETTHQHLAEQLAHFLYTLHTLPVDHLPFSLPIQDNLNEWQQLYTQIREHLFPFMRPDARQQVITHFEAYLNRPSLHAFLPRFRHGDIGPGNILYDPVMGQIGGVIDFGFTGLGDPAVDIASASCLDEPFFHWFWLAYTSMGEMAGTEMVLERGRFYKGTYALQEALHGFLHQDQEAFENGMADYV